MISNRQSSTSARSAEQRLGARRAYGAAVRATLRHTAAAYGYTLTIASTVAMLASVRGKPDEGDLFLMVGGGLVAFALLEASLAFSSPELADAPEHAFPFAGALNFLSVGAAFGAATGIAHAVGSRLAWLLASLVATAVYMLLVALQVTAAERLRERGVAPRDPRP